MRLLHESQLQSKKTLMGCYLRREMLIAKTIENGFPIPNAAEPRDGFPHRFERRRCIDLRPETRFRPVRRRVGNFHVKDWKKVKKQRK